MLRRFLRVFMIPEGGAGDGAAAGTTSTGQQGQPATSAPPAPAEPAAQPEAKPEFKAPAYFSQFSPDKRGSEDYAKYLGDKATITDMADAYVAMAKNADKSIVIPGADATRDEQLAFLGKLGVPETADGYEIADEAQKKMLATEYHKMGLTKGQAKGVTAMFNNLAKAGNDMLAGAKQSRIDSFDARLDAALAKSYPNKAERTEAAKETMALFQRSIQRTGLGKSFEAAGQIYDADFVMRVAQDEKSRNGAGFVQGAAAPMQPEGLFGDYDDSFKARYK